MTLRKVTIKHQNVFITFILLCILISSGILVFRHIGHSGITYGDEVFHAIVARNLTKHPLKFTLYDQPWLRYTYTNWTSCHVWLHKPPVALWTIWLSYLIFGINAFALRLPSALSLIITTWLTYRIAADLSDKRTGLIAAFLQAFNPFLFESVHGYRYSDHIDIALLLWVQVSCWFLLRAIRTGKRKNYILSGVAMGIAYLSKSYLALITFGIAFVVWCVAKGKQIFFTRNLSDDRMHSEAKNIKVRLSDIGLQLLSAIATVAPWVIYCFIYYRKEFLWEHKRVLDHLHTDVEDLGASWDQPLFDYMPMFYPMFYTALIAAVLCLAVVMLRRWQLAELFVLAWSIGVIVPHTLAQTKTPSATMIAVPSLVICLAIIISRAWHRSDWIYTSIWSAGMLSIAVIPGGHTLVENRDQFDELDIIAPFIQTNFWIIEELIGFSVLLAIFAGVYMLIRHLNSEISIGGFDLQVTLKWILLGLRIVALVIAMFYAERYVLAAYNVTERNSRVPLYETSGKHLQHELPENACLFVDDERAGAHLELMYYADRSTYMFHNPRTFKKHAQQALEVGAIPYIFSIKEKIYNYPLFIKGKVDTGKGNIKQYRVFEFTGDQE